MPDKHQEHFIDKEKLDERKEEWEQFRGETPMQRALSELGLTPKKAAEKLAEELEATTIKAQVVEEQVIAEIPPEPVEEGEEAGEPETRVLTVRNWKYSKPLIDWPTRQRARQDLNKLWGSIPDPKTPGDGDDTPLVIKITD